MRRSDENHPSRRPSFTLLTETQPRAEVDGRAAIDDSQHGVPIVADEPAVLSSLSAQPPQAAGDHNPIMRKQSSSEASAFSLFHDRSIPPRNTARNTADDAAQLSPTPQHVSGTAEGVLFFPKSTNNRLDKNHLKQLPLPPLAGTTTGAVSSAQSKALDASTAPLLLDNELKLLERQVSDEIIVEERHYRKLDVVAGHGTNDEGLCMYTHNGRVYKPWLGLSEREQAEGRTKSRGRIEYEFYRFMNNQFDGGRAAGNKQGGGRENLLVPPAAGAEDATSPVLPKNVDPTDSTLAADSGVTTNNDSSTNKTSQFTATTSSLLAGASSATFEAPFAYPPEADLAHQCHPQAQPSAPPLTLLKFLPKFYGKDQRKKLIQRIEYSTNTSTGSPGSLPSTLFPHQHGSGRGGGRAAEGPDHFHQRLSTAGGSSGLSVGTAAGSTAQQGGTTTASSGSLMKLQLLNDQHQSDTVFGEERTLTRLVTGQSCYTWAPVNKDSGSSSSTRMSLDDIDWNLGRYLQRDGAGPQQMTTTRLNNVCSPSKQRPRAARASEIFPPGIIHASRSSPDMVTTSGRSPPSSAPRKFDPPLRAGAPGGAQTKSADHSDGGSSTSQGAFAPLIKIGDVGAAGVHFSNKRLPEEVAEKKSGESSSASEVADQNVRLVVPTLDVLTQEEPTSQSQPQGGGEADAKRDCAPRPPSSADGAAPAVTFSAAEAPVEKEVEKRVASVQMNTSDTPERDPPQIEIPPAGATPARGTVAATSTGPFSETAQVPREEPALVQERTLTGASVSSSSTVWDTQPIPASSVNLNEAFSAMQHAALLARTRTRSREDREDEEQQHDDDLGEREPNRTEVGASKQKSPAAAASSSERCNHDVNEELGGRSESPRRGGDHNPSLSVGPLEDLLFDPSSPILSDIVLTGTKNVIVNDHRDFDYTLTRATTTGREEPRLVPIEDSIGEMNSIAAVTEDLQLVQFGLNGGPLPAGAASKLGGSNSAKMFGRKNSHSSGSGGKSKSAKPVAPQRTITMDGEDSGFSEEGEARDEHDNTYFENLAKVYTRSMTSEPTQGPGEKIQPPGSSILQETVTDAGDGDHSMIREVNRRRSQQVHDIDTRTGSGTTAEEVTEEDSRGSGGGPALPGALDSYFDSFRGGIPWTEYNDFGYEADYFYAKHFSDVESLVGSLVLSSPASDTGQEPVATSARNKSTGDGGEEGEGGTRFPSSLDSYYVGEGVLNFAPGMLGLGPAEADDGGGSVDLDHPGGELESGRRSRNTELTNGPHGVVGELNNDGAVNDGRENDDDPAHPWHSPILQRAPSSFSSPGKQQTTATASPAKTLNVVVAAGRRSSKESNLRSPPTINSPATIREEEVELPQSEDEEKDDRSDHEIRVAEENNMIDADDDDPNVVRLGPYAGRGPRAAAAANIHAAPGAVRALPGFASTSNIAATQVEDERRRSPPAPPIRDVDDFLAADEASKRAGAKEDRANSADQNRSELTDFVRSGEVQALQDSPSRRRDRRYLPPHHRHSPSGTAGLPEVAGPRVLSPQDGIAVAEQTGGLLPPLHFLKSDHLPLVRNNDPGRLNTASELPETHVIQSMSLFSDPASDGEGTEDSPQSVTSVTASYNIDPLYTPRDTTLLNRMTQLSSPRDRTFTFAGDPAVGTGLEDAAAASSSSPDRPGANGNSPARVHHSRSASGFGRGYGYNSSFIHRHKLESSNQHPSTASASDLKGGMLRMLDGRSKLSNAGSQAGCFSEESTNMSNPGGGPPPLPGGGFHLHNAATGSSSSRPLGVSRIRSLPHMRSSISHAAPGAGARGRSTHGTCGGSGSPASGVRGPAPEQRRGGLYVGGRRAGSYTGPSAAGAGARPTTTNLYGYYHGSYHAGYGYHGHHGPAGAPFGSRSNLFQDEHHRDQKRRRLANTYLVLEDVTWGMVLPCVCDIKIGQQTYDPLASQSKKQKCIEKYPLQSKLGFRVVGMKFTRIMRLHFKQNPAPAGSGRSWSPASGRSSRRATKEVAALGSSLGTGMLTTHQLPVDTKPVDAPAFVPPLSPRSDPVSAQPPHGRNNPEDSPEEADRRGREEARILKSPPTRPETTLVPYQRSSKASSLEKIVNLRSPPTSSSAICPESVGEATSTGSPPSAYPSANPSTRNSGNFDGPGPPPTGASASTRKMEKIIRVSKKDSQWGLKLDERTVLHALEIFFKFVEDITFENANRARRLALGKEKEPGSAGSTTRTTTSNSQTKSQQPWSQESSSSLDRATVATAATSVAATAASTTAAAAGATSPSTTSARIKTANSSEEDDKADKTKPAPNANPKPNKKDGHASSKQVLDKFLEASPDFADAEKNKILKLQMLSKVETLLGEIYLILKTAPCYKLFSSSLLFVYDMADPLATLWVYLIDFAHAFPIEHKQNTIKQKQMDHGVRAEEEDVHGHLVPREEATRVPHEVHPEDVHGVRAEQEVERDEGYLFGLRSLLRYVREMKARVESGRFGTYNPSENDLLHTLNLLSPD